MGLIDVLTQYDTKKKAAHAAKSVKHGVRHHGWLGYPAKFTGLLPRCIQSSLTECVCVCFAGRSRNLNSPPGAVR